MKKITKILILTMIFSLSVSGSIAYGASLNDINKDIKDSNQKLKQGKAQEQKLDGEIEDLEQKIGVTENKIEDLQTNISNTEVKIAKVKEELKKAEEEVQVQNDNLNIRLRTMYKNDSIGFLDVLLGSGSISEFISNLDMVKKVYASDKDVLGMLEEEYAAIERKKNELTALENQLKTTKAEEAQKQKELSANKDSVSKKKANVVASNEALEDNIAELNSEADRIQQIIEENERKQEQQNNSGKSGSSGGGSNSGSGGGSTSSGGGSFTWPVPGYHRISSEYGWRNCPFHGREFHSGIDIPASYGKRVVAAQSGTVIYAGYLGSYGNAVIVSHGNKLYTLYGHNSSISKWSGSVKKGQTIAKIGSTGASTGNHSHFEVRKGGNSHGNNVSPWKYL